MRTLPPPAGGLTASHDPGAVIRCDHERRWGELCGAIAREFYLLEGVGGSRKLALCTHDAQLFRGRRTWNQFTVKPITRAEYLS